MTLARTNDAQRLEGATLGEPWTARFAPTVVTINPVSQYRQALKKLDLADADFWLRDGSVPVWPNASKTGAGGSGVESISPEEQGKSGAGTVRILILKDAENEANVQIGQISKAGFTVLTKYVDKNDISQALKEFKPDVILSAGALPSDIAAKSMLPPAVRVLILEDVETDAELEIRELRNAGINAITKRVETRESFIKALDEFKPDVVLSDYSLPAFNGRAAIEIVRQKSTDLPVILVTGVLGDQAAVELMKAGITDYLLKDSLARLGPAVRQALAHAEDIKLRKDAEAARDALARIAEGTRCGVIGIGLDGIVTSWNAGAETIYGYAAAEILGKSIELLSRPEEREDFRALYGKIIDGRDVAPLEAGHLSKDGQPLFVSLIMSPIRGPSGELTGVSTIAFDITAKKMAEEALMKERALTDAIIGNFPGTFFVLDREGHYIRWNDAQRRLTGLTNGRMPKAKLTDTVAPADRDTVAAMIQEVFEKDQSFVEARVVDASGQSRTMFFTGRRLGIECDSFLVGHGVDISPRSASPSRSGFRTWLGMTGVKPQAEADLA